VKEKRIELLRQGRVFSPADLVGCRPAGGELVPVPQPGEAVVFYDHFPRGFVLPASDFLRQFLDHFHLQPHHIGVNAMMTLAAFAALCEAYLDIWPSVELFRWLIYFKTQTVDSIPVVCGATSFYARKTVGFPGLKGKESCKKWQRSFFYVRNLKKGVDYINLPPFDASGPGERDSWSASLPRPTPDMAKILQRIVTLQEEGNLKPSDLLLPSWMPAYRPCSAGRTRCASWGPTGILPVILPRR
jgi:hypothetical protein